MKVTLIEEELSPLVLKRLEVRRWRDDEEQAFCAALDKHHYLKSPDKRQMLVRQVVCDGQRPVALLVWTHGCRALLQRDKWVGWDRRTCSRRLALIAQNNRFLLLTSKDCRSRNLASRVLALSTDHLKSCWKEQFGHEVLLAETFVDPERFTGGCYRAAGWHQAGQSAGFRRFGCDYYQSNDHPKDLWLKALSRDARELLRDPSQVLPGEKNRAAGKLPVSARIAESLSWALMEVPDPRRRAGRQFPLRAMLSTAVLALASGSRTVSDIFRFCQDLTAAQRSALGFRRNEKAPKVVPPPGESCWRKVLTAVDPEALSKALNQWLQSTHARQLPEHLSIDGKVIGNNIATLVSLVDARDGTPVAQACAPGNGKELALTWQLIEGLPEGSLDGKTVSGDALYANRNLVRTLVQDKGAEVIMQLKGNQPETQRKAQDMLGSHAPPFCAKTGN